MPHTIQWGHTHLSLVLIAPDDGPVRLAYLGDSHGTHPALAGAGQPLVEILVAGEGSAGPGIRYSHTRVGSRLRYQGHQESASEGWQRLRVDLADAVTGLTVRVHLASRDGIPAVSAWTEVVNGGSREVTLHAVTSLAVSAWGPAIDPADLELSWANSDWSAENRWHHGSLRPALLPDIDLSVHDVPRGRIPVTSHGTWSSGEFLPLGALVSSRSGRAWVWQIEHNGAWHWEVGERRDGGYLAVFGPTDAEHQWRATLAPGASFRTVTATLAHGAEGLEEAVAALTRHRRAARRPHRDHTTLPVVFNDYMNTLNGDPTAERLLPLIDAAALAGAEYFCVDAGWYDEDGHWWDSVGEWQPSQGRFPSGLNKITERIRDAGMVPGLWLEPEVIGVRSAMADRLPADAFFQRDGRSHVENGRYHLDLRHPAAREHLDRTVDRLVEEFGVGYFKLDYNVNPGPGTDRGGVVAPGAGLLDHNRAYLDWLDGVLDRHPGLVLENCASGAMRCDYAILSRLQLQSTSDQQRPDLYPPIAASAPLAVAPEQSASWAYPQPEMTAEEIAFTMCTAMLGRLYLSGFLDRMTTEQHRLVAEGVAMHQAIRSDLAGGVPFWPLGLPGWTDPWVALGLRHDRTHYLTLWRRRGAGSGPASRAEDGRSAVLKLPGLRGRRLHVECLYPMGLRPWECEWDAREGLLRVTTADTPVAARLFRLTVVDP